MFRDVVRHDLRLALRSLRRRPGYTAVAVLTLALGIGANTAVFSAVNGVLIRPLPFGDPDRIVRVFGYDRTVGWDPSGRGRAPISLANYLDWSEEARSFEATAAYDEYRPMLTGEGIEPEQLSGASVTTEFFDVLQVQPAVGRFFRPDEDVPGSTQRVVLEHGFWQRRFAGDPGIVGRTIELSGVPYEVIGVAPAGLEDPGLSGASFGSPQLWRSPPSYFATANRGSRSFTAIARLRDGVSVAEAERELASIMARLEETFPEENAGKMLALQTLREDMIADARTPLLVLLAAAGLVLLIACANVANLALVRALDGERDFAVRSALGASRGRVAAQVVAENAVVALMGGALGAVLAVSGSRLLRSLAGEELARATNIGLDLRVLAFAALAVVLAGVLFGLAPVLMASRANVAGTLREGGRGATAGRARRRLQRGLVALEVALSCALLVGAGLLIRSLSALQAVDTGVEADGLLVATLVPPTFAYDSTWQVLQFYRQVDERVQAIPGVRLAGAIDILPMSGSFNGNSFVIEGRPEPPAGERWSAETRSTTPRALEALGIDVVRGRPFDATDRADAPLVVLINEAMASRWWPDGDAVGARVRLYNEWRDVIGVVRDVHEFSPDQAPGPGAYLPMEQAASWPATLLVRTEGDPLAVVAAVRRAVAEVEPRAAFGTPRTMGAVVAQTLAAQRFRTLLLGTFAAVALLLAVVGIYGVVSRAAAQRRHEVGIRMSLGAGRREVLSLLLGDGLRPVLVGVVLGLAGGYALARVLTGLLFGVQPLDPVTFLLAPAALTLTAVAACLLPAGRASRTEPASVLRNE